jgi:hypothetical protein
VAHAPMQAFNADSVDGFPQILIPSISPIARCAYSTRADRPGAEAF